MKLIMGGVGDVHNLCIRILSVNVYCIKLVYKSVELFCNTTDTFKYPLWSIEGTDVRVASTH